MLADARAEPIARDPQRIGRTRALPPCVEATCVLGAVTIERVERARFLVQRGALVQPAVFERGETVRERGMGGGRG